MQALQGITDTTFNHFANLIAQGKTDWKSWADAGRAALADIEKEILKLAVLNPLKNFLFGTNLTTLSNVGGVLGGLFGFKFHEGGVVGVDGAPQWAPAQVFRNAPRLHDGAFLSPDEVPAILQRGERVLNRAEAAAYEWDIPLRKGKHEGLISLETFERNQERLKEKPKAPARKDIREDFPLRGMVTCAECDKPLTSCWSTSKTGAKHAYYMCFEKTCVRNRKSIRREQIERDFHEVLARVTPTESLAKVARSMFKKAWDQRLAQAQAIALSCKREAEQVEKQVQKLLDRVVEAGSESVIKAYEKRIGALERQALVLREKAEKAPHPKQSFDDLFELALNFLASPLKLWSSGRMDHRKMVLRLTFAERLRYCPESGFRTPKTTFPFSLLADVKAGIEQMAERRGLASNLLHAKFYQFARLGTFLL